MTFDQLPHVFRQFAVIALGLKNRRQRFGSEYRRWRVLLREGNAWNADEIEQWQLAKVQDLVRRASNGTDHYRHSIDVRRVETADSLVSAMSAIPLLEKHEMRKLPSAFRNRTVKESVVTSTSGSTGSPMQFGHDANSIQRRFAFLVDQLQLAGIRETDPSVRLSGRILCKVGAVHSRPWLYNWAENQLFLSSYHLDARHGARIADKLRSFQPVLLDGYPSAVLEVLRLIRSQGGGVPTLKAIITTAETLRPGVRDELAALSGVPVMDYYAASEGVPFIQQCPFGTYHVRWQSGIFEVLTADGAKMEGDGELVVTSFVQDRTPLIRYRTGDLVRGLTLERQSCQCGLLTARVAEILGRVEDLVYTPDGRALGMFTYRTLKFIEGLGETQVIQHRYDHFEVNSVVGEMERVEVLERAVRHSFERALGYPVTLDFNAIDRIPKGPNGKVRLVISKVAREARSQ